MWRSLSSIVCTIVHTQCVAYRCVSLKLKVQNLNSPKRQCIESSPNVLRFAAYRNRKSGKAHTWWESAHVALCNQTGTQALPKWTGQTFENWNSREPVCQRKPSNRMIIGEINWIYSIGSIQLDLFDWLSSDRNSVTEFVCQLFNCLLN